MNITYARKCNALRCWQSYLNYIQTQFFVRILVIFQIGKASFTNFPHSSRHTKIHVNVIKWNTKTNSHKNPRRNFLRQLQGARPDGSADDGARGQQCNSVQLLGTCHLSSTDLVITDGDQNWHSEYIYN